MDKLPVLAFDLVSELDKLYPPITAYDTICAMKADRHLLLARAGAREVVEYLLRLRREEAN